MFDIWAPFLKFITWLLNPVRFADIAVWALDKLVGTLAHLPVDGASDVAATVHTFLASSFLGDVISLALFIADPFFPQTLARVLLRVFAFVFIWTALLRLGWAVKNNIWVGGGGA